MPVTPKKAGLPKTPPAKLPVAPQVEGLSKPKPPKPVKSGIYAIDFDGTCVFHTYPEVGMDCPHAVRVMKKMIARGDKLILWTMRCDEKLQDAQNWFDRRGIHLWGVQVNPQQFRWTTSRKCYAETYIDDAALGAPLVHPKEGRPYIDWLAVEKLLGL